MLNANLRELLLSAGISPEELVEAAADAQAENGGGMEGFVVRMSAKLPKQRDGEISTGWRQALEDAFKQISGSPCD